MRDDDEGHCEKKRCDYCLWHRLRARAVFADLMDNEDTGSYGDHPWRLMLSKAEKTALLKGRSCMKVVLLQSPKLLSPLLRAVFKVKKVNNND